MIETIMLNTHLLLIAGTGVGIGIIFSYVYNLELKLNENKKNNILFFLSFNENINKNISSHIIETYYYWFFIIFCIILLFIYIDFSKKLDIWLSPYNLIIYSKKKLLIPFLFYYFFSIIILLILYYLFFNSILQNLTFPLKTLLFIFLINIITFGFIIVIRIKSFKKEFSIKRYQSSFDYEKKYLNKENNNLTKNDPFTVIIKKSGILRNLSKKWLNFYFFLLQLFLITILFSYFYYFNINFQFLSNIISSKYFFIILFSILLYRFFQNYFILLNIKNNTNNYKFAFTAFYKQEEKYYYFGLTDKNRIKYLFIRLSTFILLIIYNLINCQILLLIFNTIYHKNKLLFIESFFGITFKPLINTFIQINSTFFYDLMFLFINLMFLFIIILTTISFILIYFKVLYFIFVKLLTPTFLDDQPQFIEDLLPPEFNENLIEKDLDNYKNFKLNEVGMFYFYQIAWFKYIRQFIKQNYEKHKIFSSNFLGYNICFLIGSFLWILLLIILILLIKYYYNFNTELHFTQLNLVSPIFSFREFLTRCRNSLKAGYYSAKYNFKSGGQPQPTFSCKVLAHNRLSISGMQQIFINESEHKFDIPHNLADLKAQQIQIKYNFPKQENTKDKINTTSDTKDKPTEATIESVTLTVGKDKNTSLTLKVIDGVIYWNAPSTDNSS